MTPGKEVKVEESQAKKCPVERLVMHRGYAARNLDVAKICGLNAGLCAIKKRMQRRKDCPMWLIEMLDSEIERSNCLIRPLIEHRNLLPKTIKFA